MADHKTANLLVTPAGYDDLGAVLRVLGDGFPYIDIDFDDLEKPSLLKGCDVLFINCDDWFSSADSRGKHRAESTVRDFVYEGGALYISDLAAHFLARLFPKHLQFEFEGSVGTLTAEVVDQGLAEVIGPSIQLNYDADSWAMITGHTKEVRVYLRMRGSEGFFGFGRSKEQPLLVSFQHGKGQVIYTTFHNHAQASEAEKKLLRYLVFRPLLAKAAASAAHLVRSQAALPGKEIFASIDPAALSDRYTLTLASPGTLLFVLSWEGSATLGLRVFDPRGAIYKEVTAAHSPLTVEITASAGAWGCQITGTHVPFKNFPYVLTIATRAGARAVPQPETGMPSAPQPVPLPGTVPIYFLLDSSARAGRGVVELLEDGIRRLRQQLAADLSLTGKVQLCIVPVGEGQGGVPSLADVGAGITPSLEARGATTLGSSLTMLQSLLRQATVEAGRRKPFVFVFLGAVPDDAWETAAILLHQQAQQRELNVIGIALGNEAAGRCLGALSPLPPLLLQEVSAASIQACMEWVRQIIQAVATATGGSGATLNLPAPPPVMRILQ